VGRGELVYRAVVRQLLPGEAQVIVGDRAVAVVGERGRRALAGIPRCVDRQVAVGVGGVEAGDRSGAALLGLARRVLAELRRLDEAADPSSGGGVPLASA